MLTRSLSPHQRSVLAWIFLVSGIAIALIRGLIVPRMYNESGYYVDWPMSIGLVGLTIGFAFRSFAHDQPNWRNALGGALITLVVLIVAEYLLAYGLENRLRFFTGQSSLPMLETPREMLIIFASYLARHPEPAALWILAIGIVVLLNVVSNRQQTIR